MYIGLKQVKETTDEDAGEIKLVHVEYLDGSRETLSKSMYDAVASEVECDLTQLREKRVKPVVANVLRVIRDWGMKVGELPYFSAVLNESLRTNEESALTELWRKFIPTIKSLDDVDYVAVDRVLRSIPPAEPIVSPYDEKSK